MQRKFIDKSFIIYDKKRKGFMITFDICNEVLHSISSNCKNAKKFDTKKEAQHCIDNFFELATKRYERLEENNKSENKDDWRYNRIPKYSKDDFEIFIIKTQIKLSKVESKNG